MSANSCQPTSLVASHQRRCPINASGELVKARNLIQPFTPYGASTRPITIMRLAPCGLVAAAPGSCAVASGPSRFALARCAGRRGRLRSRGPLDQPRDRLGKLRTLLSPVIDPIQRQAQPLVAVARDRVVETDPLDEPAVTPIARIGDHDVEERPLLGTAAREANHYHRIVP